MSQFVLRASLQGSHLMMIDGFYIFVCLLISVLKILLLFLTRACYTIGSCLLL